MICAGWIRFRASLMVIRRTSWIDQRINDGLVIFWCLLWFGVSFFWAARCPAASSFSFFQRQARVVGLASKTLDNSQQRPNALRIDNGGAAVLVRSRGLED